jgi:hypothetical protein
MRVGEERLPTYLAAEIAERVAASERSPIVLGCFGWLAALNILYVGVRLTIPSLLTFTAELFNELQGDIYDQFQVGFDLVLRFSDVQRLVTPTEFISLMNPGSEMK